MFIDPLNPLGKETHSSLQSKKQNFADKRADLAKKQKKEREMKKFLRKLQNIRSQNDQMKKRKDGLNARIRDIKHREDVYYRKYNAWKEKMEKRFCDELKITEPLEKECKELRDKLTEQQNIRMEAFKAKMDPIIIREAPSKSANYKMQAKYLQYEIYPLTQRLRLTQMRADGEEMKRRGVEKEVWQLRDKISDYNAKIGTLTKGLPISKTMLSKISDHKKRWKKLCNVVLITKRLALNKHKN